jgi:2,3-bisphosphoglycerate-independent phosphoglycerate mutase
MKDAALKTKTIEDLDRRLLGNILPKLREPCAVAILPDHPTPIQIGTHTRDPVPFTIFIPNGTADGVKVFDEVSAIGGGYGMVTSKSLLKIFVSKIPT